jgi:ABC-type tungstate transport system permease subunit
MKFIEKGKAFFTEENESKLWCANKKNPHPKGWGNILFIVPVLQMESIYL